MAGFRELLIARHGQAKRLDGSDRRRELTTTGKRDAQRLGVWLQARDWMPQRAVASPASRARVTAEKLLKAGGMTTWSLEIADDLYEAEVDELLAVLGALPSPLTRVLVVGHNPSIERAASFLAGISMRFEPGMLARLVMPDDWTNLDPGCATLDGLIRPAELPEKFPYPGPGGSELRDRPPYYYTQSAVMPFRRTDRGVEILAIGSSSGKHLVVPKGIVDPGMTPQASAAKEAREEAGIEGEVDSEALGAYRYDKWGSQCRCSVFAMEITAVLDEPLWEERHRGRQWLTPGEAAERLKHKGLREMVGELVRRLQQL